MKRIILIIFISFITFLAAANERNVAADNISFRMPETRLNLEEEEKPEKPHPFLSKEKKAGIALTAVGSSLLSTSVPLTVLTVLLITNVIENSLIMLGYVACSWVSYLTLLYGSILLPIGIYILNTPALYIYKKYYITKIIRNIGIVMTATSPLPIAGMIATCIFCKDYPITFYSAILDIAPSLIIVTGVAVGQLIAGIVMTAVGSTILYKRYGRMLAKLSPDITLTHDEKKGYNEGYGVSLGMRIKI